MMKDIFVSYRRSDSSDVTGRIFDQLKARFGGDRLFKDVDSIPLGKDFRTVISKAVGQCEVLLAVIGKDWLNVTGDDGRRRIDDPNDYVHIEIAAALNRGIPVIPVLVENTSMPRDADLPEPLRKLAFRNGTPVRSDPDFYHDMDRLCSKLAEHLTKETKPWAWALGGIAVFAILFFLVISYIRPTQTASMIAPEPGSQEDDEAARDLYRKGLEALKDLDAPRARADLERALGYADLPEVRSALAEALVMLGMDDRAYKEVEKALEQAGKLPPQERLLVEARCFRIEGKWDKAISRYQELQRFDPEKAEYALGMAEAQMENGSLQEAFEAVEAMKRTSADPRLDLLEASIAFKSADCTRQHNAASRVAEQARRSKLDLMRAEALIQRGLALHCLNKTPEALNDFDAAAVLSVRNRNQVARAQNARGGVLYQSGNLSEARESYEEALKGYEQLKDEEGIAAQRLNIAIMFSEEGKLASAEKEYKKAIKVFHEQGHRTEEALAIGNLGLVVANQGRIEEATSYMQSAVELIRGQGLEKEARQLCNIAWVRRENLELRTAAASLDRCLKLANEIQGEPLKADALFEQGNLLIYRGKLEEAEEHHRRALKMREELKDHRAVAESLLALAEIHLERDALPEASSFAERALRQFKKERMPDREAMAEVVLARVHLKRRELDKARSAIGRAQGRAARSEVFELRVRAALGEAQILAATGALNKARDLLEARLAETRQRQHPALERQVRFALAELELLHGDRGRGRELLSQVEESSRVHGYHLIAAKAARLLADS